MAHKKFENLTFSTENIFAKIEVMSQSRDVDIRILEKKYIGKQVWNESFILRLITFHS